MKLAPEQFDALVNYIDAKFRRERNPSDPYLSDREEFAYMELEEQLKGDQP